MLTSFELFQKELNEALAIIDGGDIDDNEISLRSTVNEPVDAESLFERCDTICKEYDLNKDIKPPIHIIHHLACSGGSLISKCLSAMPNVYLLSEVHPHSNLQHNKNSIVFSPSDIARLALYSGVPEHNKLADEIFLNGVITSYTHIKKYGGNLILRDHTHSDYFRGDSTTPNSVVKILEKNFTVLSLVTLRNPIDSFISLRENGWLNFKPNTFEEYCKRTLAFLSFFKDEQIILYEKFVESPLDEMKVGCLILDIKYNDMFVDLFDICSVTGDSGRKGNGIKARQRREIDSHELNNFYESESYKQIIERFPFYKRTMSK